MATATTTEGGDGTAKTVAKKGWVKGKAGFDWAWQKSGVVGTWMNKQAGKLGMEAFWPTTMDKECDKAARILWTFTHHPRDAAPVLATDSDDKSAAKKKQRVLVKIPPQIIEKAEGLAIFTVFRTGFGLSGASGSGVIIARDSPTSWGAPSGLLCHTIAVGWLAGLDVYDCVLVLRNRKAVDAFTRPKVSLGAEISIAAGPIGNGAQLETGIELAPVLHYTKSKGIYGGVSLDGNIIIERSDENRRAYDHLWKAKEILAGGVPVPGWAAGLQAVLAAAEGKPFDPSDLPEQVDVAPSEAVGSPSTPTPADGGATLSATSSPIIIPSGEAQDAEEERIKHPSTVPPPPPRPPRRLVGQGGGSRPTTPRTSWEQPASQ